MPLTVILSFTKALDEIAASKLSERELLSAIFCPGCLKGYLEKSTAAILITQAPHQREAVTESHIDLFKHHIAAAERDGRVIWRRILDPVEALRQLSSALARAGYQPLDPKLSVNDSNENLAPAIASANSTIEGAENIKIVV